MSGLGQPGVVFRQKKLFPYSVVWDDHTNTHFSFLLTLSPPPPGRLRCDPPLLYEQFLTSSWFQGPRGFGANIIIIDEAASVRKDMFYCVILPVATVWSTALIAISSPKDSDNWFTRLMRVTDATGKDVFMSFSFQSVCRECKKLEPREMVRCTHTKNTTPLHKDKHKMDKLQLAYEMENMTEEYMQEHLGIPTRSSDCAYAETLLQKITDLPRVVTDPQHVYKSIREVVMCIDPNGGGMNRCGLLIGYLNAANDDIVVCIFFFQHHPTTLYSSTLPLL